MSAIRRLYILAASLILFSCAPDPQWSGSLMIWNKTDKVLVIESNLQTNCHWTEYNKTIEPDHFLTIAETKHLANSEAIVIEAFATNIQDGKVDLYFKQDEERSFVKSYTYEGRFSSSKELFNLSHCIYESGEDLRKNFHSERFIFEITQSDIQIEQIRISRPDSVYRVSSPMKCRMPGVWQSRWPLLMRMRVTHT